MLLIATWYIGTTWYVGTKRGVLSEGRPCAACDWYDENKQHAMTTSSQGQRL